MTSDIKTPGRTPFTVLLRSLARREFTRAWVFTALASALLCIGLARVAVASGGGGFDVFGRFLRRPDLALLGLAALIAALRVAQRLDADYHDGWLQPWHAAGGDPRRYALALIAAVSGATGGWFITGSAAFAAGVAVLGQNEMLVALPVTLAGGVAMIFGVTAFTAMFGVAIRESLAAFLAAAVVTFAPGAAAAVHYDMTGAGTPKVLTLLAWIPPLITAPTAPTGLAITVLHTLAAATIAALLAGRLQARQP